MIFSFCAGNFYSASKCFKSRGTDETRSICVNMLSMKPLLYKVETYIVPEVNKFPAQKILSSSKIDGIQVTCQSRIIDGNAPEESLRNSVDDVSSPLQEREKRMKSMEHLMQDNTFELTDVELTENLMSNRKTVCDASDYQNDQEDFIARIAKFLDIQKSDYKILNRPDSFYPVKQFKRVNSLTSIDERSESSSNADNKGSDLCRHGYKNGCTATISSPKEVSGEIFEENWLRKIETLRQREAAVTAKEIDLQNRERELFRREKDFRIIKRLLQNKLQQMESEQRQQGLRNVDRRLKEVGRKLKSECQQSQETDHLFERGEQASVIRSNEPARALEKLSNSVPSVDSDERIKEFEKKQKCLARLKSHWSKQSSSNKLISYGSMRFKERPKESYDDLNSTLSADPGDSSFVKTSERFNPEAYKKPYAFTRSASERWVKQQSHTTVSKVQDVADSGQKLQEEKVFRKLSENINAVQHKDTKFQNYGLVDRKLDNAAATVPRRNLGDERDFFYLDLATNKKPDSRRKDRPVSWNGKTNEWLQKKRQTYLATKDKPAENKENIQCDTVEKQKPKSSKVKTKIFTMFR